VFKFVDYTAQKKELNKPDNIVSRWKSNIKSDTLTEKNENKINRNLWKITKLKIKNKTPYIMKSKEEESQKVIET